MGKAIIATSDADYSRFGSSHQIELPPSFNIELPRPEPRDIDDLVIDAIKLARDVFSECEEVGIERDLSIQAASTIGQILLDEGIIERYPFLGLANHDEGRGV
jgi:hypothetical protein